MADNQSWLDWAEQKAKDVAGGTANAVAHIPSSGYNFLSNAANAIAHFPTTAATLAEGAVGGAHNAVAAVFPRVAKAIDAYTSPEFMKKSVSVANAIGGQYAARYGSPQAISNTIQTDPIGAAADLSMLLGTGGGTLSLAGKVGSAADAASLAGRAGAVAGRVGQAASAVGKAVNPVYRAGKAISFPVDMIASGATRLVNLASPPKVINSAGELTPAANAAITNSGLSPDLFDEGLKNTWANVAAKKGVTAASAREALLTHTGVPVVTRGVTTLEKASKFAPDAKAAIAAGKEGVAQSLQNEAPDVESADVGQDFINSAIAARGNRAAAYAKSAGHNGAFAPESVNDFFPTLEDNLKDPANLGLPTTVRGIANTTRMPVTNLLINGTRGQPGLVERLSDMASADTDGLNGALPNRSNAPEALTLDGVENLRRDVTQSFSQARTPDDVSGLHTLLKTIDDWSADQIKKGNFSGDGDAALADIAAARKAHSDFLNAYPKSSNPTIRAAWRALEPHVLDSSDGAELSTTAPPGLADTIGQIVRNGVLKPNSTDVVTANGSGRLSGAQTLQQLTAGNQAPLSNNSADTLHDLLRSSVYEGNLPSDRLNGVLNDDTLGSLFSDNDKITLRQHAAANDMLNARPTAPSSLDRITPATVLANSGNYIGGAGGLIAGAAAPHLGPIPGLAMDAAGAFVGSKLGNAFGKANSAALGAKELSGAPATSLWEPSERASKALGDIGAWGAFGTEALTQANQTGNSKPTSNPPKPVNVADLPDNLGLTNSQNSTDSQNVPSGGKPMNVSDLPDDLSNLKAPRAFGGRAGYKFGGQAKSADVERLVTKLIAQAKKAKKRSTKHTEPLLNRDDSHIIAALNAAKSAI